MTITEFWVQGRIWTKYGPCTPRDKEVWKDAQRAAFERAAQAIMDHPEANGARYIRELQPE